MKRSKALPRGMSRGFTLIEIIVVLVILSSLLALSITGATRYRSALEYKYSVDQVLSDVRLTQQMADASHETCRIEFKAGKNEYLILKSGELVRTYKVSPKVQFYGKSYFSFVPAGYTEVGGSGTLFIGGSPKIKKIIVSSQGRVRVE